MQFTIGFSPCPNDTFIFDALVNKKIDTGDFKFQPILEDVETLNELAIAGKLDISKLSYPAFFQSCDKYALMRSGGAMGVGVGPLLISTKQFHDIAAEQINHELVALPGANTTANLLFSFAFPNAKIKKFMIFSDIEDAVLREDARLGVIIHENRFTYQQKGLHKLVDLGGYWEQKMKIPIPLGGIAIKRSVEMATAHKIEGLIRKSLQYAWQQYPTLSDYVKLHSQTMSEDVMRQHIELYVNKYSEDYGEEGRNAILVLYSVYLSQQNGQENDSSSSELFLS